MTLLRDFLKGICPERHCDASDREQSSAPAQALWGWELMKPLHSVPSAWLDPYFSHRKK